MKIKNTANSLKFNKFGTLAFLDGLDIFLNLSIVTYLSIFFFKELDNRFAILISTFVVLLSFFSRNNLFCVIEKVLIKFNKTDLNLYIIFAKMLFFSTFFLTNNLNALSIFVFALCRFLTGNLFYLAKKKLFF